MVTVERRQGGFSDKRRPTVRRAVVGVDGGGTKTEAVILDGDLVLLGSGLAGPSNPLRVGIVNAAAAIREAIDRACEVARVRRTDLVAAEIGLAGARKKELSARMRESLLSLGIGEVVVVGDADIALYGATEGEPGLIVIAGTGSICCGSNARGKTSCAGGWGPIAGDEGAGAWISRRALRAIAHAVDGRGRATALTSAACAYFHVSDPIDLSTAIYSPTITNERLAGFGRMVIKAAKAKDAVAREILCEGGRELGIAASAVIRNLKLERETFQVGYVGGIFDAAGELVLASLRDEVSQLAPKAYLAPPRFSPAVAAARMAQERVNRMRLAG
ncbi:MAG TPA: BadF/BadG/BcrA/BcrD ATPase family protein [Pyrinomonadaceae bacterium]|nr:BadF/BadG/BcrA/BcrD ATPase family protein [Pyrinomonadaceae bacterium]